MSTPRTFSSFICKSCRQRLLPSTRRHIQTTPLLRADPPSATDAAIASLASPNNRANTSEPRRGRGANNTPTPYDSSSSNNTNRSSFAPGNLFNLLDPEPTSSLVSDFASRNLNTTNPSNKPHRLHVYATKHNTHLTLVQPPTPASQTTSSVTSSTSASASDAKKMVDVLMSVSAGNIGFRKAGRGSYDAAYQLGAFLLKQVQERGIKVEKLEVVLRGFGAGREAVTKALLGSEGRYLRGRVVGVVDATRLKLGGPRSKKPRRLG
ncbi:hypothetical protein LTR78_007420 [Recurvomyces mirabilis]|uniref:Translational machinery component n=1 Tax=Recurvomyces mirabilis TaxID=574656 RepID=A0AAE0TUC7_9PEZI|nr:hypothetical protein LTR78_007420 [Recurvomyces mirabilis]KAK5160071.1 hypothetical protein LTS14_002177 [Recurvomyces mirabilis]